MQVQRKSALFLVPGMFLFFGLSVLLFSIPSQYPLIVLLFFTFVLTTAVMVSMETAAVFGMLVTLIELAGVGVVQSNDKPWLAAHVVLLWAAVYMVQRFSARAAQNERSFNELVNNRQIATLNLHKERDSLDHRLADLGKQAALRQHLFDAVQQLASLLDPVMVRQRLMEFVRSIIGKGTIHYFAGAAPRDPMDRWLMERKLSLLVTDLAQDGRFKALRAGNEVRSVLAAPILVERQLVGIVRLNGFEPQMFSVADLRILEALSLMASLALENLQLLAKLQEGAVRDNLTGLYTRKFFDERVAEEILQAGRFQTEFCLLMMDIDHFKRYNDTYGHAAGDQVLVRFAQVLGRLVRPVDILARYGGEEFVLILPQTSLVQARGMAETIRQTIAAEVFQFGQDATTQERVTVSIGLSHFPQEATIASQLLRVADYRLYQAKEGGRNRVIG
jgi:diguanylate cyclase (GGDEF)-like protein